MKTIKRILLLLALLVAGIKAGAQTMLEQVTDAYGVTYQIYTYHPNDPFDVKARIISAQTNEYVINIPDKVQRSGWDATVTGFDPSFTCSCPNVTTLVIKESSQDGTICGNFLGMPKLRHIYFHDPSEEEAATGKTWSIDSETNISVVGPDITVHLSEVRKPHKDLFSSYFIYEDYTIDTWKNYYKVKEIRCTYQYDKNGVGVIPTEGRTDATVEGAVVYIAPYCTEAKVPAYCRGWSEAYIPYYYLYSLGQWKITRFGYPDVTTELQCNNLKTLTFEGDIKIEKGVLFDKCYALEKMIFNGDANISQITASSSLWEGGLHPLRYLKQMDFHGDVSLPAAHYPYTLNDIFPSLEKVYFYGPIPSSSGGLSEVQGLTVYVDMDKYEIEDYKTSNTSWSSINMQPIDPSKNYRKVTVSNPGEGTFKVRKQKDNSVTWLTIKPNTTRTIEVDKGSFINASEFSLPESSIYKLVGFVFNDTTRLGLNEIATITEKTNTFTANYRQMICPEGTEIDIHFTKIGDGDMEFRDYDENQWALIDPDNDEWLDLYDMSRDGEEYNYTITFHDGMDLCLAFSCTCNKPVDGIVEQCYVIVNGMPEPVKPWQIYEDNYFITIDYAVEIDGDMDIKIIHKNNGRKFSAVNGAGGTIDLYREGVTEPISTIGNGATFEKYMPKDIAHYAIITPNEGKEISALFVNKPLSETARLQLDASQYLQEDSTYRVPLTGFGEGDDAYRLSVLYVDKPCYTFNLSVVGDGSLKCIPFREEDGDIQAIREVTASEAEGRHQAVKAYYEEIGETGYVEFYVTVPKEGETVKVYMDGVEVSDKFTLMENMNNQYLRGVISSNPTEEQLGVLNSASVLAIYEEDSNVIDWKASMIGDTGTIESADILVAGGDAEINLRPTMHDGTTTFNMAEIGTDLAVGIYAETGKQVRILFNGEDYTNLFSVTTENGRDYYLLEGNDLTQFFVDGNWVFSYTKKEGTTWTAQLTGEVGNGAFNFGGHDLHFALNADNPLDTFVDSDTEDPTITSGAVFNGVLTVPTGYTFNILFNGQNLSSHFEYGNTENGLDIYYAELECTGTELSKLLTNGFWTIEIMKKKITWTAKVTGDINEQTYIGSLIDGGDVLDMDFFGSETTQKSETFTPGDISAGQWAVWIIVKPGQKVRLLFNGDDVSDLMKKTISSNDRVEYDITNSTADLNQFLVDGTWLFEVKDPEITWTSVASGDAQYWISIQSEWDGDPVITELDSKNNVWMSTGVVDSNHCNNNSVYLFVEPGYSFKASFNGTDITNAFTPEGSENGMIKHVATKNALDQSLLATDGVWTFEFTKNGVTWSAVAAGDVVGGNRLNALTFESELEVDVNKNQLFDSMTYEGDDRTLALNSYIYVRNNSNFQVWFNGVECTDKFTESETLSDGTCKWAFNSTDPTVVAPYAVDGTWVVIFYDDKAKYDVNGDGTISIADVTKLVNVILGKE